MNKTRFYIAALVALGAGWKVGQPDENHQEPSETDPLLVVGTEAPRKLELPSENTSRHGAETDWPILFAGEQLEPLVEALREAGFSHKSMEIYLRARLHKEMGLIDLIYPMNERWWESTTLRGQRMLRNTEINRAIDQRVADLLGEKPENEGGARIRVYRFGDIPLEKTEQIDALLTQRNLEQMRRQEKDDGVSFAEHYVAFHQSLREILTDSEYRAYLVRNGSDASSLKQRLQFLDVTEEQFESVAWRLEMVQLAGQVRATGPSGNPYQNRVNQYHAAREIRAILGDAGYFEYSRRDAGQVQPNSYKGIVPPATILAAEEIKFRRYDEIYNVYENYGPSDPLRAELRAQVDNRYFSEAKMLMSEDEFRAYRASNDGRWISSRFEPPGD